MVHLSELITVGIQNPTIQNPESFEIWTFLRSVFYYWSTFCLNIQWRYEIWTCQMIFFFLNIINRCYSSVTFKVFIEQNNIIESVPKQNRSSLAQKVGTRSTVITLNFVLALHYQRLSIGLSDLRILSQSSGPPDLQGQHRCIAWYLEVHSQGVISWGPSSSYFRLFL